MEAIIWIVPISGSGAGTVALEFTLSLYHKGIDGRIGASIRLVKELVLGFNGDEERVGASPFSNRWRWR